MVITVVGENAFERREFVKKLKSQFISDYGKSGIEEYQATQLTPESLPTIVLGASLFAEHRLVILRQVSEASELVDVLVALIPKVPAEVTVVLLESQLDKRTSFFKTLKKDTDLHEFTAPSEVSVERWISEEVLRQGGTISPRESKLLLDYCGADQLRLGNEISKLVAYDPKVTAESITLLVERNPKDTVFELIERAMTGNHKAALKHIESLEKEHADPFQIASMIVWQANILAVVMAATKSQIPSVQVSKEHKINPYVVSKSETLVRKVSAAGVKKIVQAASQMDIDLKSGISNPWRAIENAVVQMR